MTTLSTSSTRSTSALSPQIWSKQETTFNFWPITGTFQVAAPITRMTYLLSCTITSAKRCLQSCLTTSIRRDCSNLTPCLNLATSTLPSWSMKLNTTCCVRRTRTPRATPTGFISRCSIGRPRLVPPSTYLTLQETYTRFTREACKSGPGLKVQMADSNQTGSALTTAWMWFSSSRMTSSVPSQRRKSMPVVATTTLSSSSASSLRSRL